MNNLDLGFIMVMMGSITLIVVSIYVAYSLNKDDHKHIAHRKTKQV